VKVQNHSLFILDDLLIFKVNI